MSHPGGFAFGWRSRPFLRRGGVLGSIQPSRGTAYPVNPEPPLVFHARRLVIILLPVIIGLCVPGIGAASRPGTSSIKIFRPLLADPREDQFRMKLAHYREQWRYGTDVTDSTSQGGFEERSGTAWDVGIGANPRLDPMRRMFKWKGPWDRYQFGLSAGVFAYFDRAGKELLNADYQFGTSLDMLWSGLWSDTVGVSGFERPVISSRLSIYHRSTHLGDEYLTLGDFGRNQDGHPDQDELFGHPPVKRVDLTFEAVRGLVSVEMAPDWINAGRSSLRAYAGGELKWAIRPRIPAAFSSPIAQLGFEIRSAGNQEDPHDGWLTRFMNRPFGRPFFETEWFTAVDFKLARPYDFASCDNPDGDGEVWTPNLWTDCRHGRESKSYAGSWHAMIGFSAYSGAHRRIADGGRLLASEILIALEWYHGYSPNGQFLDQRLETSPLAYIVPSITIHF